MFKVGQRIEYIGRNNNVFSKGDVLTIKCVHGMDDEYGWVEFAEIPGHIFYKRDFKLANGLIAAIAKLHDPRKALERLAKQMVSEMRKSLKSK